MRIRRIALNGFRNYEWETAELGPETNVISGENALAELQDLLGELDATGATLGPDVGARDAHTQLVAAALDQFERGGRVGRTRRNRCRCDFGAGRVDAWGRRRYF